jgi:hypothetical protein
LCLQEAQLLGARDRLAAPADAQFAIELAIVPLDGVDREIQLFRDPPVGEAGGDEAQDLELAVVEGLDPHGCVGRRRTTDDELLVSVLRPSSAPT